MGVCNCSMFCCTLHYVHSSLAIILMGKRELVALLGLSSWCLVIVVWLFLAVPWMPWVCLQSVIVELPDHTHVLFFMTSLVFWNLSLRFASHVTRVNCLRRSQQVFIYVGTMINIWPKCKEKLLGKGDMERTGNSRLNHTTFICGLDIESLYSKCSSDMERT